MIIRQPIPNGTTALIFGILSVIFGCLAIGLVFGIIGLVISNKAKRIYALQPLNYSGYSALNAGFILSIIGTVIGGFAVLYYIFWIVIFGGAFYSASQMGY